MKTNTIYVEVPCSERLPKVGEILDIICNRKETIPNVKFEGDGFYDNTFDRFYTIEQAKAWLEKREDVIVMTKEEFEISKNNLLDAVILKLQERHEFLLQIPSKSVLHENMIEGGMSEMIQFQKTVFELKSQPCKS